jgi:PKD repeat protein
MRQGSILDPCADFELESNFSCIGRRRPWRRRRRARRLVAPAVVGRGRAGGVLAAAALAVWALLSVGSPPAQGQLRPGAASASHRPARGYSEPPRELNGRGPTSGGDVDEDGAGDDTLSADFSVKKLVHVELNDPDDPSDDQEEWRSVGLSADDPIELGLRVRFDGSLSTGETYYAWYFGDGASSSQQRPVHAYSAPGTYTVLLRVRDAGMTEVATVTKAVHVAAGLELLSQMPFPSTPFSPIQQALDGTRVWAVSSTHIGTADLSTPEALPALQLFPLGGGVAPSSIAFGRTAGGSGEGRIAVLRGSSSVELYRGEPTAFGLLGSIPAGALGVQNVWSALVRGDCLVLSTGSPRTILVCNASNPGAPTALYSLATPRSVTAMAWLSDRYLIARMSDCAWLLDASNLEDRLTLVSEIPFTPPLGNWWVGTDRFCVNQSGGISLFTVYESTTPDGTCSVSEQRLGVSFTTFAAVDDKLIGSDGFSLYKYSIVDPGEPALFMQSAAPAESGAWLPAVVAMQAAGNGAPVRFLSVATQWRGFLAVAP